MMDLVLQLNDQLKEMEKELESLIQLKQASIDSAPPTVIPIVTTVVHSTLAAALAPTGPMATALSVSTLTTLATTSTSTCTIREEANRLVKALEDVSIQTNEMNKLKEKVSSLKTDYKLAQIMHKEEQQKDARMNERIKGLEKELTLTEPIGKAKEQLWANIIDSVNDIWPYIHVIF